jgi:hypothetical protein
MELTVEQLLQGKATKIKEKEFFTTKAYVEPFFDRMSKYTEEFIINVKPADQISLTPSGEVNFDDIVYNRVWIQAVLPDEYAYENHKRVMSMIYALDTRKPVVKMYTGALNMACLNLCVFNPDALNVAELEPTTAINFSPVNLLMGMTDTIKVTLEKMSKMTFNRDNIYEELGLWVDRCITAKYNSGFGTVKIAESAPVNVYKDLFYNEDSGYYTQGEEVDGFTVYNAFTDLITQDKKDLVNKFEKTLLIKDIMDI